MEKYNINNVKAPLERIEDHRGHIVDVFYDDNIKHITIIKTKPNNIRGNHYHKKTEQRMLILSGKMEYWYKDINDPGEAKMEMILKDEMVFTPINEIHALRFDEDTEFMVFTSGERGGKDYEDDTYRVSNIIV